jgi:hypothetical protein
VTASAIRNRPTGYRHRHHVIGWQSMNVAHTPSVRTLAAALLLSAAAAAVAAAAQTEVDDEGLCSHDEGVEVGIAGEPDPGTCPQSLAEEFHDGWREGRQLRHAEREIAELEELLVERSRRYLAVTDALTATETHLVRADADAIERARWIEETKQLTTELRDLEADIDALELEIGSRKEALASLRLRVADAG